MTVRVGRIAGPAPAAAVEGQEAGRGAGQPRGHAHALGVDGEVHQRAALEREDRLAGSRSRRYWSTASSTVCPLTRPLREDQDERRVTVAFEPSDAPVLREAARNLSARQERVDERIEGYVSALARDRSEPEGRVTLRAVIDGRLAAVQVDFEPSDYRHIAAAHAERRSVVLEGDLHQEGGRWRLANPRDLLVLDDDSCSPLDVADDDRMP